MWCSIEVFGLVLIVGGMLHVVGAVFFRDRFKQLPYMRDIFALVNETLAVVCYVVVGLVFMVIGALMMAGLIPDL